MFDIFEKRESQVRSYCRNFPIEFNKAKGAVLTSIDGQEYIDFFAGAGAMNFGHNNEYIKKQIMDYLSQDKIIHALDMFTEAKEKWLNGFTEKIFIPKNLDYKIMCCGATGTNAVEAALKLARKNTKRTNVFAFTGAFHGMTLGSLAMTSDRHSRLGAGLPLNNVTFVPYYNAFKDYTQSLDYLQMILSDDHSGIDLPAAIVLETVQAEGGVNVAPKEWLQGIRKICDKYGILMIVDDIQVGICRTGDFFSWERANVIPDMVVLSKSISGFGLPMAILLVKPEYDIFSPAEHNGTFRGNQLGFVGSLAGIEYYHDHQLDKEVKRKEKIVQDFLERKIMPIDVRLNIRGIGLIWGIDFMKIDAQLSKAVMQKCVENGLIIERAGREDSVVKILPPLTIEDDILLKGLSILENAVKDVLSNHVR